MSTTTQADSAWMTTPDVADHLQVTDRTVRRMIAAGELPAYRLGPRLLRVKRSDVDALLRPIPTAGGASR